MTGGSNEGQDPYWDADIGELHNLINARGISDPGIANFFARALVDREEVLQIIDVDEVYKDCRSTSIYQEYAKARSALNELEGMLQAYRGDFEISKRVALVILAVASSLALYIFQAVMLSYSQFNSRPGLILEIPLTLLSGCTAWAVGLRSAGYFRERRFPVRGIVECLILLVSSVSVVVVPLTLGILRPNDVWVYVNLVTSFGGGALMSDEMTAADITGVMEVPFLLFVSLADSRQLKRRKDEWLDDCLRGIVAQRAEAAIHRLLGADFTKFLVEENSEGLRRLQDPRFFIATKSGDKLSRLIDRMDGGSIAVTGPRGAGKTTLLRQICELRYSATIDSLSIYIPAPAEYDAREFLAELFQQLCDAYLRRHESEVAAMRYRGMWTMRDRLRAAKGLAAMMALVLRGLVMLMLLTVVFGPTLVHANLPDVVPHFLSGSWRSDLDRDVWQAWEKYRKIIQVASLLLAFYCWPGKRVRKRCLDALRRPQLVRKARSYSIHLKIERTSNWGANLSLPALRGFGFSLSKGTSDSYVPWSFPELVSKLREFLADMTAASPGYGGINTVIIGIDEIDRIGSVEQAESFIGEIKAIFGIRNCFFLVSVAEDIGFLFSRRSVAGQSTLEHAFDDVIVLDALKLVEAREMLSKRVGRYGDAFVFLAHALSGGLPREMIRVARHLLESNLPESKDQQFPRVGDLAFRLVAENMAEVLGVSRNQLARLSLPAAWGEVFYKLQNSMALLRSKESQQERRKVIDELCGLCSPQAADGGSAEEADTVAASAIVAGLAAFAQYSLTVIEAFDNDRFDLDLAIASMSDPAGGSYEQLAAARLELGISPESSKSIIHRFRAQSGLPPLH